MIKKRLTASAALIHFGLGDEQSCDLCY